MEAVGYRYGGLHQYCTNIDKGEYYLLIFIGEYFKGTLMCTC